MTITSQQPIGPFVLTPVQSERIWGVTSLEPWFDIPVTGKPIGELWMTAAECAIENGSLRGETLAAVTERYPELLADKTAGGVPLLIKILLPREKLSVQVHPNDEQARAIGEPRGKTECWYVLSADPGATIALGFREPLTTEEMREAIEKGTLEDKLEHVPVKAGDMVYVEAGTIHAIGPGVVILETQEYSDITYRLYDYGRPRPLHLDQGLAVTRAVTGAGLMPAVPFGEFTRLIKSPYFTVDRFDVSAGQKLELGNTDRLQILIALAKSASIQPVSGGATQELPKSHAVILPGEGVGYQLTAASDAQVIRVMP
jgi:mannose-6-phosphate isomerase